MRLSCSLFFAFLACAPAFICSSSGHRVSTGALVVDPFREESDLHNDEALPPISYAGPSQEGLFARHSSGDSVRLLGGRSQGPLCCVSSKAGRVDCFIRGPRSTVLHMSIEKGEYSDWEDLGGWIAGGIECVSRDEGLIDVLALNSANNLLIKQYAKGEWAAWKRGTDILLDYPSCVARTPSVVDCFVRHSNNIVYYTGSINGVYNMKIASHSTYVSLPPTCGSFSENVTICFAVNYNNQLFSQYFTVIPKPVWGSWFNLGLWTRGKPSVTAWPGKRLDVFALSIENEILHKTYNGEWGAWFSLGGEFESTPECLTTGPSTIYCLAVGTDMFLYGNTLNGWEWSGWHRFAMDMRFRNKPSCILTGWSKISCYLITLDKMVVELVHTMY